MKLTILITILFVTSLKIAKCDSVVSEQEDELKVLSSEDVSRILKKYYPKEELFNIYRSKKNSLPMDEVPRTFNKFVTDPVEYKLPFREFFGLYHFKNYGYRYLYPDKNDYQPYQAFEMANALVSIAEGLQNDGFDYNASLFSDNIDDDQAEFDQIPTSIWRGETGRDYDFISELNSTRIYEMTNKFRSFSWSKSTALGFCKGDTDQHKTNVLYELRTRKKLFRFDTSVDNIFLDREDEVILFSNIRFRVIGMEVKRYHIHVRMLNVDEMNYDDWRQKNYEMLKTYYDRAQHVRPFNTTAPMPKPPSKSQKSSELKQKRYI